eukprot:5470759-Amphidinium_carterae.3
MGVLIRPEEAVCVVGISKRQRVVISQQQSLIGMSLNIISSYGWGVIMFDVACAFLYATLDLRIVEKGSDFSSVVSHRKFG